MIGWIILGCIDFIIDVYCYLNVNVWQYICGQLWFSSDSVEYNNKINVLFCNFIMDVFQNNGLPYNSDSVEWNKT